MVNDGVRLWGRGFAAVLVCAMPAASGCGSDSEEPAGKKSALCASVPCAEGAPCGCEGMDPSCDCFYCQGFGECQPASDGVGCAPVTVEDCNRPNGSCERYGACALSEPDGSFSPRCIAMGEDDCRASAACREEGVCGFIEEFPGQCFAVSDEDCAASTVCKEVGCCKLIEGSCLRSNGTCPTKCCGDELC